MKNLLINLKKKKLKRIRIKQNIMIIQMHLFKYEIHTTNYNMIDIILFFITFLIIILNTNNNINTYVIKHHKK